MDEIWKMEYPVPRHGELATVFWPGGVSARVESFGCADLCVRTVATSGSTHSFTARWSVHLGVFWVGEPLPNLAESVRVGGVTYPLMRDGKRIDPMYGYGGQGHQMAPAITAPDKFFNPATGEVDTAAVVLDLMNSEVARAVRARDDAREFEGLTVAGIVEALFRQRLEARAERDAWKRAAKHARDGLDQNDAVLSRAAESLCDTVDAKPGHVLVMHYPADATATQVVALQRFAVAIESELRQRMPRLTQHLAPQVILAPPDVRLSSVRVGDDSVRVTVEHRPSFRPTDVPAHVAREYADAAAASYGTTVDVVRSRRARRRNTRHVVHAERVVATDESPFVTPDVRAERRGIGTDPEGYDPDEGGL